MAPACCRCRGLVVHQAWRRAGSCARNRAQPRPGRHPPRRAASTRGGPDAPKFHADLLRRAVSLKGIASDARGDAVGPVRHTPLRAGHDVVDRDRLGAGLRSAVLAGVVVPLGDIPPAERHRRPRQAVVVRRQMTSGTRKLRWADRTHGLPFRARARTRRPSRRAGTPPARRPSPSRSRA